MASPNSLTIRTIENTVKSVSATSEFPALLNGVEKEQGRPNKLIATHNGVFHADEALACFLLVQLPEYQTATILRTRTPEVYNNSDIVVDVGGIYDASARRFDHHQRSFADTMSSVQPGKPWTIKLSSAGLVYCHFGRQVIAQMLNMNMQQESDAKTVELLYDKMYDNFIQEMDAIDNGVPQSDKQLRYSVSTGLSSRVKRLNPRWNDPDKSTDERFKRAMKLTGEEFVDKLSFYHEAWLPARQIVEAAVKKRFEVDSSGEIIRLDTGGCPWQDHLFQLEEENNLQPSIKYALYQDDNKQWRIQAVPAARDSFASRLPLPEAWRGLRDEELSQINDIPDCVFTHQNGFIGGNKSYEGVLKMALLSLAQHQNSSSEVQEATQKVVPI